MPLIEARKSISEIFQKAAIDTDVEPTSNPRLSKDDSPVMKILVPIDGSVKSLKALYHANYLFRGAAKVSIYLLHVIEWTDENEENIDEELSSQIQEEGKLILRSVVLPRQINDYKRIVKLGDPAEKITELADKFKIDMIVMGKKGIGKSTSDLGHVTQKVLKLASKPVVLLD